MVSLSGKYGHCLICRVSVGIQEIVSGKTVHDTVKWYIRVQCYMNTIIHSVEKKEKNVYPNSEVKGGKVRVTPTTLKQHSKNNVHYGF